MDLKLNCDYNGFDNVRFSRRGTRGLVVAVSRSEEDSNILLSDNDVERLYEYLGEHLGKDKESVPEVSTKSTEEVAELLEMSFNCNSEPSDTLYTHFDNVDEELYIKVYNNRAWGDNEADVYLSSEDALTMAKNIIKAFEGIGIDAEPVAEEYEAASKAELDEVVADLKDLRVDFRSSMKSVVEEWSQLNKDLNQVHVEISQIQNDIFNTNESTKVKLESLGKHTEDVSKEVVAAMEHLATRIDENSEEINLLRVKEDIRKMKSDNLW